MLVGSVSVGTRLEQDRQAREAALAQEHAQPALAELALAEQCVAIAVRTKLGRRVVQVEHTEPLEPDLAIEFVDHRSELAPLADLVARRQQVTRVEADSKTIAGARDLDHLRELVERAADREAGAGGVLEEERAPLRAPEGLLECLAGALVGRFRF